MNGYMFCQCIGFSNFISRMVLFRIIALLFLNSLALHSHAIINLFLSCGSPGYYWGINCSILGKNKPFHCFGLSILKALDL